MGAFLIFMNYFTELSIHPFFLPSIWMDEITTFDKYWCSTCMCELIPQVSRLSVMSCTTSAVRSPTLMWRSQSLCDAEPCITDSTCSSPVFWSLAWPCWSSCCLLTLGKRSLLVRGCWTHVLWMKWQLKWVWFTRNVLLLNGRKIKDFVLGK